MVESAGEREKKRFRKRMFHTIGCSVKKMHVLRVYEFRSLFSVSYRSCHVPICIYVFTRAHTARVCTVQTFDCVLARRTWRSFRLDSPKHTGCGHTHTNVHIKRDFRFTYKSIRYSFICSFFSFFFFFQIKFPIDFFIAVLFVGFDGGLRHLFSEILFGSLSLKCWWSMNSYYPNWTLDNDTF